MTDVIPEANLSEDKKQSPQNLEKDKPKKKNLWYVDVDLRKHHDLSFIEAAFFCMILQLQCSEEGFCRAKNYYFIDALGISDDWIERALKKLLALKLIWIHYYNTKNGKRRQIVTSDSIRLYQAFLQSHQSWAILQKFRTEFVLITDHPEDPNPGSKATPQKTQTTEPIPTRVESDRPPRKMRDDPPRKTLDAINTTYLPNRENDVTCQQPADPAASDEASSAASSSNLKEELEQSYSAQDVAIGMKWYEMQSESKRASMRNPIACIIQALKGGYAQEEVASANKEVAAKLAQDRDAQQKRSAVKREMTSNERLAQQLIFKFAHCAGWRHRLDSKCFVVHNESVEKVRDEETGASVCFMPDGTKRFGAPAVRVDFELPPGEFKQTLKDFFRESQWVQDEKEMMNEG